MQLDFLLDNVCNTLSNPVHPSAPKGASGRGKGEISPRQRFFPTHSVASAGKSFPPESNRVSVYYTLLETPAVDCCRRAIPIELIFPQSVVIITNVRVLGSTTAAIGILRFVVELHGKFWLPVAVVVGFTSPGPLARKKKIDTENSRFNRKSWLVPELLRVKAFLLVLLLRFGATSG